MTSVKDNCKYEGLGMTYAKVTTSCLLTFTVRGHSATWFREIFILTVVNRVFVFWKLSYCRWYIRWKLSPIV